MAADLPIALNYVTNGAINLLGPNSAVQTLWSSLPPSAKAQLEIVMNVTLIFFTMATIYSFYSVAKENQLKNRVSATAATSGTVTVV